MAGISASFTGDSGIPRYARLGDHFGQMILTWAEFTQLNPSPVSDIDKDFVAMSEHAGEPRNGGGPTLQTRRSKIKAHLPREFPMDLE